MKLVKKIFSIFFRFAIGLILLVVLFKFKNIEAHSLLESIRNVNKPLLFLSFIVYSLIYVFCFLRWVMLLKTVKIHLPLKRVAISYAGGTFFSLFLPSTIGGDLARSIDLSAHTQRPREVVATVLLDRLSGYAGLVIVALFSLIIGWDLIKEQKAAITMVAAISALLIIILVVLFNEFLYSRINRLLHSPNAGKIREMITSLHQEIYVFRRHKKVIVNNLVLSVLVQAVVPLASYIMALSLGANFKPIYFFVFWPIIGAVTLMPISIGGLGVRENLAVFFFTRVGMSENLALLIALLNFAFMLIYGAIGGLIYVLTVHHRRIQPHKPSPV